MFVLWMINLSDVRAVPDFGKLENKGQSSKASSWKIGAIRPFGPKSPKSSESTGHGFPLLTSNFLGTSLLALSARLAPVITGQCCAPHRICYIYPPVIIHDTFPLTQRGEENKTGFGIVPWFSNFLKIQTITFLAVQFFHENSQFFDVSENSQNWWFSDSDFFSKNQNWLFLYFLKNRIPRL